LDGRRTVIVLPNEEEVLETIAEETATLACTAIEEKGAFSLCVPGSFGPKDGKDFEGAKLIAKSLQILSQEDLQFDKWHVFFAGDRLDSQESFLLAKEWIDSSKIPGSQVHPIPQLPGAAEGAAAQYTAEICMQDESVLMDSEEGLPALDLLLLDMAADGTVGRLRPDSSEVKELGSGKLILPIEEAGAEAAVAAPDFMNAARCVVLVATGAASAATVATALAEPSPSCPASLLRPQRLTWLLDAESAASV